MDTVHSSLGIRRGLSLIALASLLLALFAGILPAAAHHAPGHTGSNLSLSSASRATQSSTYYDNCWPTYPFPPYCTEYPASQAKDTKTTTHSETFYSGNKEWWQIDLGSSRPLSWITLKLATYSNGSYSALKNFYIFISNNPFISNDPNVIKNQSGVTAYFFADTYGSVFTYFPNQAVSGRYVRVQNTGVGRVAFNEAEIWGQ